MADPFLLRRDGRLFLFFEAWRRGTAQGDLCWAERDAAGAWRYSGVALDEPFHLSYPFVFQHEGEVFMIPESRSQGDVRLYAARTFPGRFELRRVLLTGKRYADTSLVAWQGRFYLFTSTDNGTLELYFADALDGPYRLTRGADRAEDDARRARAAARRLRKQSSLRPCTAVYECPSGHSKAELPPSGYSNARGPDPCSTEAAPAERRRMHHLDPLVEREACGRRRRLASSE